jgi:hypothetical protein
VAVFITNNDTTLDHHEVDFAAIWEHYLRAKFLYPAKLGRLDPIIDQIGGGWPKLLSSPAEVFQMHVACRDRTVLSSLCAFRDPGETYVVQHAVSQGQPQFMIKCLQSVATRIGEDPNAKFISAYFRPQNRWTVRATQKVSDLHPPELGSFSTQEYLTCEPRRASTILPASTSVEELEEDTNPEVLSTAIAAVGHLRARALGIGYHGDGSRALRERYLRSGLLRGRKVLGALRDGAVAGIALCHTSSFPINFSFLCSRVEILVHPEAPDRANVIGDLTSAAIREAALREEPVCALLVRPEDARAAIAGGFNTTGRQYSNFLWARENEQGWPSTVIAFERWYEKISQRYARNSLPLSVD